MARPKFFDYDPEHDETIIIEGVEGAEPAWIGFDLNRLIAHVVMDEGTSNATGDGVESITRSGQQANIEGATLTAIYLAHKDAFDEVVTAMIEGWAVEMGKTGSINA